MVAGCAGSSSSSFIFISLLFFARKNQSLSEAEGPVEPWLFAIADPGVSRRPRRRRAAGNSRTMRPRRTLLQQQRAAVGPKEPVKLVVRPGGPMDISRWREPPDFVREAFRPGGAEDVSAWSSAPPGRVALMQRIRWLTPPANVRRPFGPWLHKSRVDRLSGFRAIHRGPSDNLRPANSLRSFHFHVLLDRIQSHHARRIHLRVFPPALFHDTRPTPCCSPPPISQCDSSV
jgi:hypothetical protein